MSDPPAGPRKSRWTMSAGVVDQIECAMSVALAAGLARMAQAEHVSWAAFAGYMVMRGHASDTTQRAALRLAGTVLGGLLALWAAPKVADHIGLAAASVFVIGAVAVYGGLRSGRAYAWLFFGLTFAMAVFDRIAHPWGDIETFVTTRILETAIGISACVVVSLASGATLRRRWPAPPASTTIPTDPGASLGYAVQGGAALAILAALAIATGAAQLAQGAVTIAMVMFMPARAPATETTPVSHRAFDRIFGCAAGGAFAALILLFTHGWPSAAFVGLVTAVAIGRGLENKSQRHRYIGAQFALAAIVALTPDNGDQASLGPAIERLRGIAAGLLVLEPILLLGRGAFLAASRVSRPADRSGPEAKTDTDREARPPPSRPVEFGKFCKFLGRFIGGVRHSDR